MVAKYENEKQKTMAKSKNTISRAQAMGERKWKRSKSRGADVRRRNPFFLPQLHFQFLASKSSYSNFPQNLSNNLLEVFSIFVFILESLGNFIKYTPRLFKLLKNAQFKNCLKKWSGPIFSQNKTKIPLKLITEKMCPNKKN